MNYIHEKAGERIRKFIRGGNSMKINFEIAKKNAVLSVEIELEYIDKLIQILSENRATNDLKGIIRFDFAYLNNLKSEIENECNDVKYFDKKVNCFKCF